VVCPPIQARRFGESVARSVARVEAKVEHPRATGRAPLSWYR
jgi:hypothetical protein